ncbi:hypothetical protein [Nitrosospira briensis]|uniref:hypothetical protein n=1 Tax=Nitrosospira briensis TaxID=35799 RepID=UPI0008E38A74|nr:hypothetical protein [Nitrosospira briensis]SFN90767.1 type IV secretion system protein VirB6/type IV secretion system protein TrbL [Nitrosospira briensis]
MNTGLSLKEMGVMMVVSIVLLMLVNKIPHMLAGIVDGGSGGIGNIGADAAAAATGMAAAITCLRSFMRRSQPSRRHLMQCKRGA